MLFRRLFHEPLAQASYLIACQDSKEAIVVDPLRDPAPYLEVARLDGVRITHVTETHVHADFLSGAAALARESGAELLLSGEGDSPLSYAREAFSGARWLGDGDVIQVGAIRLEVLHVPGHTPEHVAFLVTDEATSDVPVGLVSGDFLFVGDVGRPDLLERAVGMQGTMQQSARQLHASLRRLKKLPEFLQIWPGHGAGSACGKSLGAVPQSTLGYERRANWAFDVRDEAEFVERVLAGQPEPPAYFARMKKANAHGAPHLEPRPTKTESELREALRRGAQLVDTRHAPDFAAGHLPGSLNLPLGKSFLGWAGSVLPVDRDLVILATPATRTDADHAARDLALIGIDRVVGVIAPERVSALAVGPLETLSVIDAASLGASPPPDAAIVDVRNLDEWQAGHLPGARHIPLPQLADRLSELRGAGPLIVHCQGGSRSAVAASVLQAAGFEDVSNLTGGFGAWEKAGNAPVRGD
jgi:hydroxyacylglutathione hydrolase